MCQVLGNVKGVVAVVLSVLWFKNPISFIGMLGYGITVGGVVAYSQVPYAPCFATPVKTYSWHCPFDRGKRPPSTAIQCAVL